jgi:regulator of sigma E protease
MLLSVVTFIFVLSVLVLVHEFGHFVLARILGVGVEEFAIGLPLTDPIWKMVRKDGLQVSVYPALFGGFVRLLGEEYGGQKEEKRGKQFWSKSKRVRIAVIVAGVVANVVLAVTAFSAVVFFSGIPTKTDQVRVVDTAIGSPAEKAGIKGGDVIVGVEATSDGAENGRLTVGKAITTSDGFIEFVEQQKGITIVVELKRDGKTIRVNVVPRTNPPKGEGAVGVVISNIEMKFLPLPIHFVQSLKLGVSETWQWIQLTVGGVGYLIGQLASGKIPSDVAGPVGIAQMSGTVAKEGILAIVEFIGILSINLAVLNVLPFPALDGGQLLFIGIEALVGRRVAPKIEHWVHMVGMVLLLTFMLFITIRDIERVLRESGFLTKIVIFR